MPAKNQPVRSSRREFLKTSGALAAGLTLAAAVPRVHAADDNTIKVALVGCGGRGGGAIMQAMSTDGPTKLVALADVFEHRTQGLLPHLKERFPDGIDPNVQQFIGFDAYKHAVDAVGPGGVVLFCTAPAFRPMHVEYAVEKGVHVFMEKSFAVDPPGVRRMLKAGELAKQKNLKIAGGLMSRHCRATQHAVEQLHNGIIGERVTCWAYRMHNSVGFGERHEGESHVSHQIRNYSNFTWLNGSFLLDWLIHNLDVCCWVKGAYPVRAQGMGGRTQRKLKDQLFDHYAVEYSFEDGTRLFAQGRHQDGVFGHYQSTIHGATGCAIMGEAFRNPKIFKGHNPHNENLIWEDKDSLDHYQTEHDDLFKAIRNDTPYNEAEYSAHTAMVGILGRMAVETGQEITWNDAINSDHELAPNLEKLTMDGPAPVMPDEDGNYPIAMPGVTKY